MGAVAQVIEMRSEDDIQRRVGRGGVPRRREEPDDVVGGPALARHAHVECDLHPRDRKAGHVRIPAVELLLDRLEALVRHAREDPVGHGTSHARREDARAPECRIERHRDDLARVRRPGACDHEQALRSPLARRERLVAQAGLPGESGAAIRVDVLRGVAQDEDDLVFDVEAGVAVVRSAFDLRSDEAVAREDDLTRGGSVVGEGQGLDPVDPAKRLGGLPGSAEPEARAAVVRSRGELERQEETGLPGQRFRTEPFELVREVANRLLLPLRARHPSVELVGSKELHRPREDRGRIGPGQRDEGRG